MERVYLDNAATTRVREEVIEKMQHALATVYGNPSSTHGFGRSAKTAIEQARKTIAAYLNAKPAEIIFTSGGTEADNMILRSAVRDLGVKTLITSRIEHHAVLHTAAELLHEYGIQLLFTELDTNGNPDLGHLEALLQKDGSRKLVSLMHVNNEIGNILDIEAIGGLCKAHGALFHSDTVQSIGHYSCDAMRSGADFLTAAAHKFHGPKGVGFAYIKRNTGLKPLIFGGSQERGFRAGTESFHNIVGLEAAMIAAHENMDEEREHIIGLKNYFVNSLREAIPGIRFNGLSAHPVKSTYTLVNVCLPCEEEKAMLLLFHLDLKGIACSRGSACQSGSNEGSHVLQEILSEDDLRKPSLRFSFSVYNNRDELDYVVSVLKDYLEN